MTTIDTSKLCSQLVDKLFNEDGEFHQIWLTIQADPSLSAAAHNRQLTVYRNGKRIMILAGKAGIRFLRVEECRLLINP